MLIFLIGFMGCGKTSVGRALAKEMGYAFADMDALIEQEQGLSTSEIFQQKGEAFFRQAERTLLERFQGEDRLIVSTGGGVPCFGDNMEWMNHNGLTVFLDLPAGALASRLLSAKSKRPLLQGKSEEALREYVSKTLAERRPYYAAARLTVSGLDVRANDLLTQIRLFETQQKE